MSVSSYSSECSSSSSSNSSSSSSSSTSSGGTGRFSSSSKASFSSCSTIVEAQPTIRPFGCPVFNYFWIEKRSKTYPKKKYYWNFKSHAVAWERPVPKDVPLPIYTNTGQASMQQNVSDHEDVIVSDPEDAVRRKRRLAVKLRNRRLALEEEDDAIQVLSVKKTIKSKKMLDTFWKLHRFPGESVKDVKKRLLTSIENTVKIKTELDSIGNEYNTNDVVEPSMLSIKQEPPFNENNFSFNLNDSISIVKKDENSDSDSDPEHVSRLIKQEYLMPYEGTDIEDEEYDVKGNIIPVPDEQMEKDSEDSGDSEDSEDEDDESDNFNDNQQDNHRNNNLQNPNEMYESESDNFEYEYEAPYLQEDLLSVEINEDNNGNIFLPIDDDIIIENINWNFDQPSKPENNSALTCSAITSLYGAPKVKQITSKHLLSSNRRKRKVKKQKKKTVPKLIIKKEPPLSMKSEPESSGSEKPIICDRYGVRTINYNHPMKVKPPNWQVYTKLSDSSGNESSEDSVYKSNKVRSSENVRNVAKHELPATQRKDEGALELRNWFPKQRGRKRKMNRHGSDSSWYESDVSDCTSIDEFDRKLIRMKKEKRTSSSEREAKADKFDRRLIRMKKEKRTSSTEEVEVNNFDQRLIRMKKEKRTSSSEGEVEVNTFDQQLIRVKKEKRTSSSEGEVEVDKFDQQLIWMNKEKRTSSSAREGEVNEFDRKLIRMKKENRSSSSERETKVNASDRQMIRMKKEKRSSSSETEAERSMLKNRIVEKSIMKEFEERSPTQQDVESKISGSLTPSAELAVDLSRVKVEVHSDLEEQSSVIKVEENAANDADQSDVDSSSGSSHTCSRSSCSRCTASSSSSSSDSDSDDDTAGNKNIVKEHVDI